MSFTPPPPFTNGKHPVADAARFLGLDPCPAVDEPKPEPKPAKKKTKARPESPAEPRTDRDTKGRFTKNNPGGPGNPYARKIAALRQSLIKHLGPRELYEIVRLLVGQAMCGNIESTKVLFQYVIGKAPDAPDPDRVDLAEWQQYVDNPATAEAVENLLDTLPHEQALTFLRGMWPAIMAIRAEKRAGETGGASGGTGMSACADPAQAEMPVPPGSCPADEANRDAQRCCAQVPRDRHPSPNGEMTEPQAEKKHESAPIANGKTTGDTGREMPPSLPIGNPHMRKVAELRRAVVDAVNDRDMEYIGQLLMSRAMVGHLPSTKLLFRYVLGKPTRPPDPDTLDQDEFRRLQESPVTGTALNDTLHAVPHGHAVAMITASQQQLRATIAEGFGCGV